MAGLVVVMAMILAAVRSVLLAAMLPIRGAIRLWPLLAATLLLQGCFFLGGDDEDPLADCRGTEEYQQAGSIPALQVPEGLAEPSATSVFEIPGGPQAAGQDPEAGCLARPPLFFDRPVGGSPDAAPEAAPEAKPDTGD